MSVTEQPNARSGQRGTGRRRPSRTPKGRQVDPQASDEVRALLGDRDRRRDLLIEHLHLIQDRFGFLSAAHLAALAQEMKLALAEVYEVATFYAHFDVVKEGETPPPPVTVRVCDSLSCALEGAEKFARRAAGRNSAMRCAWCARPAWAPAIARRSARLATSRSCRPTRRASTAAAAKPAHAHAYPTPIAFDAYVSGGGYALLKACATARAAR